jgi:GNAT superfamily N-acetyltransferase
VISPHRGEPPTNERSFRVEPARPEHVRQIHGLIRGLADYERLTHLCVATERDLAEALFGTPPAAEALIVTLAGDSTVATAFALFFHTYSTFLGRRTLWLEDLFVVPEHRGLGIGRALLHALARLAVERGCGRFEWAVLDWNGPAIRFYNSLGASVLPDWRIARMTGEPLVRLATASPQHAGGNGGEL